MPRKKVSAETESTNQSADNNSSKKVKGKRKRNDEEEEDVPVAGKLVTEINKKKKIVDEGNDVNDDEISQNKGITQPSEDGDGTGWRDDEQDAIFKECVTLLECDSNKGGSIDPENTSFINLRENTHILTEVAGLNKLSDYYFRLLRDKICYILSMSDKRMFSGNGIRKNRKTGEVYAWRGGCRARKKHAPNPLKGDEKLMPQQCRCSFSLYRNGVITISDKDTHTCPVKREAELNSDSRIMRYGLSSIDSNELGQITGDSATVGSLKKPTKEKKAKKEAKRSSFSSPIQRLEVAQRMSRIVKHNDTIYLCGQVADNAITSDITVQTQNMLAKVDNLLLEAGSDREHILSATIYVKDMKAHFAPMNAVWDSWVPSGHAPARACVEAAMARDELLVEISVVAAEKQQQPTESYVV